MLSTIKAFITWPIAAVLVVGALCFTAISLWAPPGVREVFYGGNGLLWTIVGILMRSPRDTSA
jgi:hypothetical protein